MRKNNRGTTFTDVLVIIGIFVFLGLASIPAYNSISGKHRVQEFKNNFGLELPALPDRLTPDQITLIQPLVDQRLTELAKRFEARDKNLAILKASPCETTPEAIAKRLDELDMAKYQADFSLDLFKKAQANAKSCRFKVREGLTDYL